MKITPLQGYVLVKEKIREATASGIILPKDRDEENHIATIIAVGPEVTLCKVDEEVLIKRYTFDELTIEGEQYLIGKQEGVFGHIIQEN